MEEFGGNEILKLKYKQIEILMLDQIKKVYLAQKKDNQEKIIIKEINLLKLDEKERDMAIQEGIVLSKLKHPNIVNCHKYYLENNKIDIIMEYEEGGDLSNKINEQKNKKKYFEEKEIIEWFIEICEGVKYIHENKIIHRDLKPLNIFLTKNNKIKIGDFGIATLLNYKSKAKTMIGTQIYLSPEIMKNKPYDYKSDIWNLGIILYKLTQLKNPFENKQIGI
jgi:NIMA (never in mitosis gene a)-related kinase